MPRFAFCSAILLCVGLLCAALPERAACAQDSVRERPRVGVVLSGGGARGAAHIGVLKVLEEARIPVDSITGVSMGAVVGALYASGMTAADLETVLTGIDWAEAFEDVPGRRSLSYRRKQDDRDLLTDFQLGLSGRQFRLPRGLIQGQKLNLILRDLLHGVAHISDFNDLPIPFRAVATDVETGDAVVLDRGELARAVRASVAVPGVLAPIEIGGRLLVDGGIASNLPIGVARDMGVDILIVVDIAFPLQTRDKLGSALAITNQMITILMRQATNRELAELNDDDILIRPNLDDMGSTDFSRALQAVALGADAARRALPRLAHLTVSEADYASYQRARQVADQPERQIEFVDVIDDSRLSPAVIESYLALQPGDTFNLASLENDIADLYGLGTFEIVDYRIVERDQLSGLELDFRRKSWGPNYLNFGFRLRDDFEGSSDYTLGARYTRTAVNRLGAEWRTDLQVGANPRLVSEFYQPIDLRNRYFIAPRVDIEKFTVSAFDEGRRVADFRVTRGALGVDLGRQLGNWGELRVGLRRASGRTRLRTGDPGFASTEFASGNFFASFGYDRIDNVGFPSRGNFASVTWQGFRESLGSDQSTNRLTAEWLGATRLGRATALLSMRGGSNLGSNGPLQNTFELGGPFALSGMQNGELRGQHFGLGTFALFHELGSAENRTLSVPVYAGFSVEMGNVWDQTDDIGFSNLRQSGSLFVGMDTFLGPVYLVYGIAEGSRTAAYFSVGQVF